MIFNEKRSKITISFEWKESFIHLKEKRGCPIHGEPRQYPTHKEKLLKELDKKKCEEILFQTKELHLWLKAKL